MDVYARLKELNLTLPDPPPAGPGINVPVKQVGNLLFVSGHTPKVNGEPVLLGKVGSDRTVEEGQEAARIIVLNVLAQLHRFLGDLNKIKSVVKTLGFVQSAEGFSQQPQVINAASGMLKDIWGDAGVGTRSAIGVNQLPRNFPVEIEFMFEV